MAGVGCFLRCFPLTFLARGVGSKILYCSMKGSEKIPRRRYHLTVHAVRHKAGLLCSV